MLLAIQTNPKQAKFYYFLFAVDPMAKSKQACGKSSSETLLYPNISSWFSTMLCNSYRSSTYVKFRVE